MPKRTCPNGHKVSDKKAEVCPECGEKLPPAKRSKLVLLLAAIAVAVVLCGLLAIAFGGNNDKETDTTPMEPTAASADAAKVSVTDEPTSSQEVESQESPSDTASPTETSIPPTPTMPPTPTTPPTPEPPAVGMGRANPVPFGEPVVAPGWTLQILEVVRGDQAWAAIEAANMFNDAPMDGMEYVLVKLSALCTYEDDEQHSISNADLDMTGSRLRRYGGGWVSVPDPALDAELLKGGETEGWVAFLVGEAEDNLIIIVDELANWDDGRLRFAAVSEGASVNVDPSIASAEIDYVDSSRTAPVPLGETVTIDEWQITVLEVLRGDAALEPIQATNMFNEPASEGMEYILARIRARHLGLTDTPSGIDAYFFNATGSSCILHPVPSVVEPEPALDVYLYPGGEYEGWVAQQCQIGETDLMLLLEPVWSLTKKSQRYLALEENASLSVPDGLGGKGSDVGKSLDSPAALGETVSNGAAEMRILEVVRGDSALQLVIEANQFNDPPEEGFEYVACKVYAKNVDDEDVHVTMSEWDLQATGSARQVYDCPSVVDPTPKFDANLYPTGEWTGWATMMVAEGETDLVLIYSPGWLSGQSKRYLSLQ